jgi:hypothetical protein
MSSSSSEPGDPPQTSQQGPPPATAPHYAQPGYGQPEYGQSAYGQPPYIAPYATASVPYYQSARPRARVVIGLTWALIALEVLMIGPQIMEIRHQGDVAAGRAEPQVTAANWAALGIGLVMLAVLITAIVFWMMWVHRTYRNLRPLGASGLRYSPGWAVGYYFIPIMNLFRPIQVMSETWRASDPRHTGGTDWQWRGAPALLAWWWVFHLISGILNQVSSRIGMRTEDADVLYTIAWLDLGLIGWDVARLLMEIKIVKGLTDLQDQRAATHAATPVAAYAPYGQGYYAGQS